MIMIMTMMTIITRW